MKKYFPVILISSFFLTSLASAQVLMSVHVQIVKAEDARRYDAVLENLMKSPKADIRKRAALAAGRIGKEEAIGPLVKLLEKDPSDDVRTMAAFALGEIESIKASDAILGAISSESDASTQAETRPSGSVPDESLRRGTLLNSRVSARSATLARLVEAAGKIAAANAKDEKAKLLGAAVLNVLKTELEKQSAPDVDVLRLGLTAVLRARPAGAEETVRKFLAFTDPNIVADALNTLARLRAKNANRDARDLLATSSNAIVRANAARVLGAAEDKEAVDVLIKAATSDGDLRVRVSAIRALATLKDANASDRLLDRGEALIRNGKKPGFAAPITTSELLEIVTVLGTLFSNSENARARSFVREFTWFPKPTLEGEVAWARIDPNETAKSAIYDPSIKVFIESASWFRGRDLSITAEGLAVIADNKDEGTRKTARESLEFLLDGIENERRLDRYHNEVVRAIPDVLRAYAAFKPHDLEARLRRYLGHEDVFVRANVAELFSENFPSQGTRILLENAFKKALVTDKHVNDAQLAMLDAMAKINKAAALDTIYKALDAPDYLVRKKAFELLDDPELINKNPGVQSVLTLARQNHKDEVWPYDPKTGTKLGQVLNRDADYRRALSRKNGSVKAVVTTEKGAFTIDLLPEDAPLTVDNFVKLARSGYFNGLEVHRVVPNFVMQDGDPRGDGNGGPGWSIRCEINMVPYERGAVGMALSGKDTGGSQWFVTHSPQPHLDDGYTVFGQVNETGMKVVDNIVRGDKIVSIRIIENLNRREAATRRKKS